MQRPREVPAMRLFAWAVLAAVICSSPLYASEAGQANSGYAVSVSTPKSDYKTGEDVVVTLTIQNVGPAPIRVWDECMTRKMRTRIIVINHEGQRSEPAHLSDVGCIYSRIPPELHLAPDGSESYQFSLLKDARLTMPNSGTLTIQIVYEGWNAASQKLVSVRSNVIAVTIAP
jgi:hypothetical protein